MNAPLHETTLNRYTRVYTGQKTFEITGETVVPDKMPDIGLLGETTAHVLLRSKETALGQGNMDGELDISVCFIPDGAGGFCKLELQLPWQVQFDDERITDRCMAVGEVAVQRLETRMLNPRKILVKAQLCGSFAAYAPENLTICDDLLPGSDVQVRRESLPCSLVSTVCERSFVVTDEYPLPPDLVGGEILCKCVQFQVEDVKTLANKLIVKGTALSDVVIASQSGGVEKVRFTSGFSFIAETDCETVEADVNLTIMPTAMYYELSGNGQVLSVEVHGVCQLVAFSKDTLGYISDAYSNFYDCTMSYRPVTVYINRKNTSQREKINESIPCRSSVSRVLFVTADTEMPMKTGDRVQIPVRLSVCVQYENGSYDWLKRQCTVSLSVKSGESAVLLRIADVYAAAAGSGVECRAVLEYELREEQQFAVQTVSEIITEEECPCTVTRPSLTVLYADGSLWDLARQYGSTVELIQAFNELEEDYVESDTFLLIPKQHK